MNDLMPACIILIDNEASTRESLTFHVKAAGWKGCGYDYAQFSLPLLRQIQPDLIVLDLDDSGTGWEFLQMLKMDDVTAKIPVVITTSAFYLTAEIRNYLLTHYIHVIS